MKPLVVLAALALMNGSAEAQKATFNEPWNPGAFHMLWASPGFMACGNWIESRRK
jgi:hypothetical protein